MSNKPNEPMGKCPRCGRTAVNTSHGYYCTSTNCKWGWETELDGSPLRPPTPPVDAPPADAHNPYAHGDDPVVTVRDGVPHFAPRVVNQATPAAPPQDVQALEDFMTDEIAGGMVKAAKLLCETRHHQGRRPCEFCTMQISACFPYPAAAERPAPDVPAPEEQKP